MVRRAKLRSVSGKLDASNQINSQLPQEILWKLNCNDSVINNQPSDLSRHKSCATAPVVAKNGKDKPPTPINNFPSYEISEGGIPDAITLEIYSLRRRCADLKCQVEGLNNKLSRVLQLLNSLRRFFRLWIFENQGETYDQIHARMRKIDTMINLIEDRMVGPVPEMEIPERWRKENP